MEILSLTSGKAPYLLTPLHASRFDYPVKIAWLGCSDNSFFFDGDSYLYDNNAARGVRRGSEEKGQKSSPVATPEDKLPSTLEVSDQRLHYSPKDLEWAKRLLAGTAGGTVLDYQK